jgi:D-alanine transaminase
MIAREERAQRGVTVITTADNRWGRVDIKSVSLLANVIAKQKGREAGAFETWFVDREGLITEGTTTNAWILTSDGTLLTRQLGPDILAGITRAGLLTLLEQRSLRFEERGFSPAEAITAQEAFITSATTAVTPVVKIDGQRIGNGRPGKLALELRHIFLSAAKV